jgi:hypothetical protein
MLKSIFGCLILHDIGAKGCIVTPSFPKYGEHVNTFSAPKKYFGIALRINATQSTLKIY